MDFPLDGQDAVHKDQPQRAAFADPSLRPQTSRPVSPVPSCVSMKSDQSIWIPLGFSSGPPQSAPNVWRSSLSEHAPVNRAELADKHVLSRVLMTHKASMKRRFKSICEGIIRSGTQTLLNKIYTELYITEGESEGVNNEHEVWQVESASRPQTTEDTAINCNDIFKPLPGQERHIRTVMAKGIAGIGKTISVQKFILDWAEERANQDVDFMFVLPFRELNLVKHDQYSLHRLLFDFHPELKELQDGEYKDCHIVFIFDGLDESRLPLNFQKNQKLSDVTQTSSVDVLMTSLIQGTLLPSALIWITSRPAATSQIPSQCISLVTEVRGFNDPQKEEYFRKRISDQNQANRIISHIMATRSLHIMCHMPVFCWISATVLQQILEQDDGKEAPKTLTEMFIHFLLIQTTRKRQKYQEESVTDRQRLLESHKGVILKLAELAFKHLENGNLMFYEEDLRECGIDVSEASMYSGMCTKIFREECVFHHKKVYCFVHLSIQEFLAALHVFASFLKKNTLEAFLSRAFLRDKESRDDDDDEEEEEECEGKVGEEEDEKEEEDRGVEEVDEEEDGGEEEEEEYDNSYDDYDDDCYYDNSLYHLLKGEVDKALDSKNGHLDLYLRFLVGISVEQNQALLQGLFSNIHTSSENIKSTCKYIKELKRMDPSPERYINLSHCLFEMNDHSLHEEVQVYLASPDSFTDGLTPAHCSALAHLLLMSEEVLDKFDLNKYRISEEGQSRLMPAVRCCRKAMLADCKLTEKSFEVLASALQSANSPLRELDLSKNDLQTSGEELLSALQNPNCKLETLRLVGCKLRGRFLALILQWGNSHLRELDISKSEVQDCEGELLHQSLNQDCKVRLISCKLKDRSSEVVVSVLQSYISQLSELDMSGCDLQTSEEKQLSGLRNSKCQLEKLRLVGCKLKGRFLALTLQWANSHLRELDISDSELQDCGGELLHQPLNQDCKVRLISCRLKHSSSKVVVSVLQSYISQLSELDMSGCDLQTSEKKLLSGFRNPNCHLEKLRLAGCKLTEESCKAVASALQSSISLKELDLSVNDLKDSGVQLLSAGLSSPHCKLTSLRLNLCHLSKASCEMMASVLQRTPSHLRELDMSDNDLQDEGVELLCVGLRDPQCKLETLRLSGCLITHEGCSLLSSALKSNASYLKQLDLLYNHPGDSGVRELTDRLNDPSCKLETLRYDHRGECRIKPGLRKYACELTLDPNTAHRHLSLSEGNRKVTWGSQQQLCPDHPERFDSYAQVLCRDGLSGHHPERCGSLGQSLVSTGQFGRCYWEAEWSGHEVYIAVAYKSMERKGEGASSVFGGNAKSWRLQCSGSSYYAQHNNKSTAIPAPSSRSSRVGVYLDWPAGTLSFYSVSSNTLTHLHTFHSTFTEPLYPGFYVYSGSSVCLCQIT
ncbi:NACHT, LRR and PYD domains-containing protein 12-like [Alosa pseudoharengus]|uniref:NACHT, LRR and PYD domains-containing protein 12-like n=1 Tax=Alosa pseudoharengus TaxID=34774 RepID=UPI003F894E0B